MNLHAKFDVSSSNRFRDMEGSQNFKSPRYGEGPNMSSHVTLSRPVNGGRRWPDIWIGWYRFA